MILFFDSHKQSFIVHTLPELEHIAPIAAGQQRRETASVYPRERIPKQAVLSVAALFGRAGPDVGAVVDAGDVRYVNRGSMALGLALQHAQVGPGDVVLLPAYHCISMIEPVVWRSATPAFYRIHPDTSVNLADIEARITPRTRALVVTHYFGFLQDMTPIRTLCDRHSLVLIEDCAHAFFGGAPESPVGSAGDYAIASAWKFFAVWDGGVLVSKRDLSDLELTAGGAWFQAKAFVNTLEQAFEYRRLTVARLLLKAPLLLKDLAIRNRKLPVGQGQPGDNVLSRRIGGWGFEAGLVNRRMSLSSRAITSMSSRRRIAGRRRANYLRLLAELGGLPGCNPLFSDLPSGVVPQVFPVLFDEPEHAFPELKRAGVPIIRFGEYLWEGMDASFCPVSADFSRRVFQFPCHQELTHAEIDWMIGEVRRVATRGSGATPGLKDGAAE